MSLRVAILTESGDGIGYGHLTRMTALASQLSHSGADVALRVDHKGSGSLPQSLDWQILDWRLHPDVARSVDVAVVDSYLASAADYLALSHRGVKVVAIDDYNRLVYPVHTVVNPNPAFNASSGSPASVASSLQTIGGCQWVLLRSEITKTPQKLTHSPHVEHAVVTLGGSDVHGVLPTLLDCLSDRVPSMTVIAGNDDYACRIRASHGGGNIQVHGVLNAAEMAAALSDCDVAVSACGQTLHELAYLGVPFVGIRVGDDQVPNQDHYLKCGLLGSKIDCQQDDWCELVRQDLDALSSQTLREQRSQLGRSIIDGRGPQRLCDLIRSL
ncbi:glycosyltransferase [Rhodopirellula maiorica SM1]|uniref:Glycosyltransferase n=1 Tax=Rhodopirellula maiorica SM1 TaxID=1265738 RepID=M5RPL5_9BACT|nr:glycosyl transferase [Rhodopirellula maiorica]EMI17312.1 glycosyltransferase [Rhodopirellula maiorica SM1]